MRRGFLRFGVLAVVLALSSSLFATVPTTRTLDIGHWTLDSQSGPTLLKSSVIVRANRLQRYWKAPDTDNYWSWLPEVSFLVVGPISTGSAFVVDFSNEAGAPWFSVECDTPTIDATSWRTITTPNITTHIDKRTTLATGTFGFTIRLRNELSGANNYDAKHHHPHRQANHAGDGHFRVHHPFAKRAQRRELNVDDRQVQGNEIPYRE